MPRITDISPQKRHSDVFNLFVDGEFVCGLGALQLSQQGIKVGQELSDSDVASLLGLSQQGKAYNAALRYLSYRPRSEHEVRSYLTSREYPDQVIDGIIVDLQGLRYVDDVAFAESWLRSRSATKPRSASVLRMELTKKRVPRDIINQVLSDSEEGAEQTALREIMVKKLRLSRYRDDKQKLTQYLLGQGFRYADIKRELENSA